MDTGKWLSWRRSPAATVVKMGSRRNSQCMWQRDAGKVLYHLCRVLLGLLP